jgi:hypothetical protein
MPIDVDVGVCMIPVWAWCCSALDGKPVLIKLIVYIDQVQTLIPRKYRKCSSKMPR